MSYPNTRLRRLRQSPLMRAMVRETTVTPQDLIAPIFLVAGTGVRREISSMPGQYHLSVDMAVEFARKLFDLGVPAVLLFGLPEHKDEIGSSSWDKDGVVPNGVRAIRTALPEMTVITDLCFCEYTSHGHCGVMSNGVLQNDLTLENLVRQALVHAEAGAQIIAPSGMLDGMIGKLRSGLDNSAFQDVALMSYAAKFASGFYGPFREAVQSAPAYGDRRSYQMDPANGSEAMREVTEDLAEGADIVMVKPALAFLDIIYRVKAQFAVPVAAYNVSGEYSMVKAAAAAGMIDGSAVMEEMLLGMKRAGADLIITYFAEEFAARKR
jgi:porphobilinogen synthase